MAKAFLPLMRGRGWGRVINLASATVAIASPVSIAYRSSKMGVIGFTRALSATLGDDGITINAVLPSLTKTAMTDGLPDAVVDASLGRQVIHREAEPAPTSPTASSSSLPTRPAGSPDERSWPTAETHSDCEGSQEHPEPEMAQNPGRRAYGRISDRTAPTARHERGGLEMTTTVANEPTTYRWSSTNGADRFTIDDPATGEVITTIQGGGAAEVDAAVQAAHNAFETSWRWRTPTERSAFLLKGADVLEEHADELALLESRENGRGR
jgi:hypothetical protein